MSGSDKRPCLTTQIESIAGRFNNEATISRGGHSRVVSVHYNGRLDNYLVMVSDASGSLPHYIVQFKKDDGSIMPDALCPHGVYITGFGPVLDKESANNIVDYVKSYIAFAYDESRKGWLRRSLGF